ncbi:hypothetical protein SAMN05660313_02816 [Cellulophaga fucicola]|uniref:Uncharacterized protein n=2 Tax=Cellulophaga fucicola TaxID=76595 RepID=A0A1K1QNJ5_9FLAO|nr:hypothetical protein SAMN05660313_02816 [Cellulophaga fucicola]
MRNLTVFELDSLIYESEYELTIREKDSVITYSYRNKTDPNKNKGFRYLKNSDLLFAGPSEFYQIDSDKFPVIFGFELYHSDPTIMDAMGPVIFNKEYGVLGFDNGMLTQYYFTNGKTDDIELPILYKGESAESNLEGIWESKNSTSYSKIHFYKNNVWKRTFINYEKDTITEKGKFTMAKDSAIFFRYFGSQHWPSMDTINDYKTSIGSFVLFLNSKNELIDNQEDYKKIYIKTE